MPRRKGQLLLRDRGGESVVARHVRLLGLSTPAEYQQWCRDRGLDAGLRKPERRPAHSLLRLCREPREIGRRREDGSAADRFAHALVRHGLNGRRHGAARAALAELVEALFTSGGPAGAEKLLEPGPAVAALGNSPGNTYVEALPALAERHAAWVRRPAEFAPRTRNAGRMFAALLRHLFARYDVPACMDEAWFKSHLAHARRRRGWFVHVASGRSIRECDLPVALTRRAAHAFASAPAS